jgi:multidrug efflux pump
MTRFFIERPIFAAMLSMLIVAAGLLALPRLPISEYPDVVPPTVIVHALFPGASPEVIADSVAAPLEQAVNGVDGMLYHSSEATSDGQMTLTVTFALGTDADKAQVQVQNRVAQALPRLPQDVQRLGVTTEKSSPDLTMVVHLVSPDHRYDMLYLSNFATLRVKDELSRIEGIALVRPFGGGNYSMRLWLDPDKLAARGLTASDVVRAIREQNVQVAAGQLGAPPTAGAAQFQLSVSTRGSLVSEQDFEDIVLRAGPSGELTRLSDVGRVELGSDSYALRSLLNNEPAAAIGIYQRANANAIQISNQIRAKMDELARSFPEGLEYRIAYDPTVFVRGSIRAVVHTLFEALALVVLVVVVFLQTWRASIIPLIAVPVSLVGTFAFMLAFGFSLNALSLFGLVLAIGIVVDDAIVVVENVERNIRLGLSPLAATHQAMREVTSPIVATALVLCAVFVPTAFISGLSGQFYRQFALTIAISTALSALNSLTLSPALAAVLLRAHEPQSAPARSLLRRGLAWPFRLFDRSFDRASDLYVSGVGRVLRRSAWTLTLYGGLVVLTYVGFTRTATGFVPTQDKQYVVGFAQLPDAASLERTDEVIRRVCATALSEPGVESTIAFPGLSVNGLAARPNSGIVFVTLQPFEKREQEELSASAIAARLNAKFAKIQEAYVAVFQPPPVQGLGTIGGFKLEVQDRGGLGYGELYTQTQNLLAKGQEEPALAGLFSSFRVSVPQVSAQIDRDKAKARGVSLTELFDTLQIYLGSLYVNDFTRFGRTFPVTVQAEARFREQPANITQLKTRNGDGAMISLGSFVSVAESSGPDRVVHYNSYPAAEINGAAAPGFTSGQAQALMEKLAQKELSGGMNIEWTELTYQQILAGDTASYVFPLCVFLVFVVLAALYESLTLPFVVILIVPMCLFSALVGVRLAGSDNNIFTQIGLIVLVGLACKNAILIVEFAREREAQGGDTLAALRDACRLRLRPILMTSIAFVMGVVPLVAARGPGAEMRSAMGAAVFAGMLGVTFFGLLLTPVFYWAVRRIWPAADLARRPL